MATVTRLHEIRNFTCVNTATQFHLPFIGQSISAIKFRKSVSLKRLSTVSLSPSALISPLEMTAFVAYTMSNTNRTRPIALELRTWRNYKFTDVRVHTTRLIRIRTEPTYKCTTADEVFGSTFGGGSFVLESHTMDQTLIPKTMTIVRQPFCRRWEFYCFPN